MNISDKQVSFPEIPKGQMSVSLKDKFFSSPSDNNQGVAVKALSCLPISVLLLSGCATDPATMQFYKDIQSSTRPTLEVTCPNGGCTVAYVDPRDRQMPKITNGWDAFNNTVNVAGNVIQGAVVPVAMGVMAVKGMEAMRGHGQTTTTVTTNTATTTDSNNQTTHTLSGTGTVGSGAYTATTTTTTDNHSQTATPTIVTQPAPVIVNPVVVNPLIVGP